MMQKPVAANHTIAPPTKPVKSSHHGLCTSERIEAIVRLMPTTSQMRRSRYQASVCMR